LHGAENRRGCEDEERAAGRRRAGDTTARREPADAAAGTTTKIRITLHSSIGRDRDGVAD